MASSAPDHSMMSIVPLGAGDLIDRAVRFYRQNFLTFIFVAAPPVLVGTLLSVGWLFLSRWLFFTGSYDPLESTVYVLFSALGSSVIWFTETVATLSVMGGASRNFVRHLLFGEPISFKDTYLNVWDRVAGLIAASVLLTLIIGIVGLMIFYFGLGIGAILIALIAVGLEAVPFLAFFLSLAVGLVTVGGVYWLFCLAASRFAYVPQVMLVEGQGVIAAIGRSISLASGNVKRFAALFAFTLTATYSALALIYVPLGWYAWAEGVELFAFGGQSAPAWYEIASQMGWQVSIILLSPVWMVGLCLLYVDERVRHEGYDIELMAARRLGEIPSVPQSYYNPLQPALGAREDAAIPANGSSESSSFTTLGLK
ncbi:MAG TPA: hypothetical protein PLX39_01105 [Pyrinomonadaceae bacterium]|nr:hypothetical protein [Pyrinomonadaceae bacterium]